MKFLDFYGLLAFSLVSVSAQSPRITTNVYPCPQSRITRLAHSWSCSKFVQCVNGYATERDCAHGLLFNKEHQQCMHPRDANCIVEDSPCPRWTDLEDLIYLTTESGSKYFMCLNGEPIPMQCAEGFVFDRRKLQCDPEGFVEVCS